MEYDSCFSTLLLLMQVTLSSFTLSLSLNGACCFCVWCNETLHQSFNLFIPLKGFCVLLEVRFNSFIFCVEILYLVQVSNGRFTLNLNSDIRNLYVCDGFICLI